MWFIPIISLPRFRAYLDPGSGSYIFQILLAGLVGSLFAIKLYWGKIVSFFKKENHSESEENNHD